MPLARIRPRVGATPCGRPSAGADGTGAPTRGRPYGPVILPAGHGVHRPKTATSPGPPRQRAINLLCLCVRKKLYNPRSSNLGCHPGESRGPYSRGRCLWTPTFVGVTREEPEGRKSRLMPCGSTQPVETLWQVFLPARLHSPLDMGLTRLREARFGGRRKVARFQTCVWRAREPRSMAAAGRRPIERWSRTICRIRASSCVTLPSAAATSQASA